MKSLAQVLLVGMLLMPIAGCVSTQIKPVSDASNLADQNVALVAFSVSKNNLLEIKKIDLLIPAGKGGSVRTREVPIRLNEDGQQVLLFQVPVGGFQFGNIRFEYQEQWWDTSQPGPEFAAKSGVLTYLGRIQPNSIVFREYVGSERKYPAGVDIEIVDVGEQDLQVLVDHFSLPENTPVTKNISGSWGDSEFIELSVKPIDRYRLEPGPS